MVKNILYLTLGIIISVLIISKDFFIPSIAGNKITVDNKKYELLKNHTRDLDVEFYMSSSDVLFKYTPVTLPEINWPKPGFI